MTDQEMLAQVRRRRVTDLSDAMDAIGLCGTHVMAPEMRPIRPGMSCAGFALTVKYVPTRMAVRECVDAGEYMKVLGEHCVQAFSYLNVSKLAPERWRDAFIVIDAEGIPAGVFGSENGLGTKNAGAVGIAIDGGVRDTYEANLEEVNMWSTKRTCQHTYGRVDLESVGEPVTCAGAPVAPGDVVCADDDGVLVIPRGKVESVLRIAEEIHVADQKMRAEHYEAKGLALDATFADL